MSVDEVKDFSQTEILCRLGSGSNVLFHPFQSLFDERICAQCGVTCSVVVQ